MLRNVKKQKKKSLRKNIKKERLRVQRRITEIKSEKLDNAKAALERDFNNLSKVLAATSLNDCDAIADSMVDNVPATDSFDAFHLERNSTRIEHPATLPPLVESNQNNLTTVSVIFIPPSPIPCIVINDDDSDADEEMPDIKSLYTRRELKVAEEETEIIDLPSDRNQVALNKTAIIEISDDEEIVASKNKYRKRVRGLRRAHLNSQKNKKTESINNRTLERTVHWSAPYDLRMSIVNLSHPNGMIPKCKKTEVYTAVRAQLLKTLLGFTNTIVAPRFHSCRWEKDILNINCADEASSNFLVQCIGKMPPVFSGGILAAVPHDSFQSMHLVELCTNLELPDCVVFMKILELQNPELNVKCWLPSKIRPGPRDAKIYTIRVDSNSYEQLCCNNGFVYFGLRRLLFSLYPFRSNYMQSKFIKTVMRVNMDYSSAFINV